MTDRLTSYTKSAAVQKFMERIPEGAHALRLAVVDATPFTLLSMTVAQVTESRQAAWDDISQTMEDHAASTNVSKFVLAWVNEGGDVLVVRPLEAEGRQPEDKGVSDLATRMDGTAQSQLAGMQLHVREMSRMYLQAHAAQMGQAITVGDKYAERALQAVTEAARLSIENAELRAENAELAVRLALKEAKEEKAAEKESADDKSAVTVAIIEAVKPYLPAVMMKIGQMTAGATAGAAVATTPPPSTTQ